MKGVTHPKFRRLTCTECGRVIPWTWYGAKPPLATMNVAQDGKVSARCTEHSEPETRTE